MRIINLSDRVYDLGKFTVPPGRRGTAVPAGLEDLARKVVARFAPELELDEDTRDDEIAKLKAELESAKGKKGKKAPIAEKAPEQPAPAIVTPSDAEVL